MVRSVGTSAPGEVGEFDYGGEQDVQLHRSPAFQVLQGGGLVLAHLGGPGQSPLDGDLRVRADPGGDPQRLGHHRGDQGARAVVAADGGHGGPAQGAERVERNRGRQSQTGAVSRLIGKPVTPGRPQDQLGVVMTEYYDPYADNARRWYAESQEKLLYWNHAIINPPVDRHRDPDEVSDVFIHVEEENDKGVVVSGAVVRIRHHIQSLPVPSHRVRPAVG